MHNHTLGWTSDNGCNVFALGWLALLTVEIVGSGIEDASFTRKDTQDEDFIQLLMLFIAMIEDE